MLNNIVRLSILLVVLTFVLPKISQGAGCGASGILEGKESIVSCSGQTKPQTVKNELVLQNASKEAFQDYYKDHDPQPEKNPASVNKIKNRRIRR